jgi:hypothetical protein
LTGKRLQHAVQYQLACCLLQYGTRGVNPLQAAHKLAIGFRTAFLYCRRVVRALQELGIHVVSWGDDERRQENPSISWMHTDFQIMLGCGMGHSSGWDRCPKRMVSLSSVTKNFLQ